MFIAEVKKRFSSIHFSYRVSARSDAMENEKEEFE